MLSVSTHKASKSKTPSTVNVTGERTQASVAANKGKGKARYVDETSQLLSLASAASGSEEATAKEKLAKGQARASKSEAIANKPEAKPKKGRGRSEELNKAKAAILAKQSEKKAKKRKAAKQATSAGQAGSDAPKPKKGVSFA